MKMLLCLCAVMLISPSFAASGSVDWSNQDGWGGACNLNTSLKQSPVDVITPTSEPDHLGDYAIELHNAENLVATNDNKESVIQMSFDKTVTYKVPGIEHEAEVQQLHFHWGQNNTVGSEHFLDGKQFAAEVHLVSNYTTSAYAVINRFFKVGDANEEIQDILTAAKATGANRKISGFNLTALYPSDITKVITYQGGLTTPTCDEVVYWIIVPEPLTISAAQLQEMRTLVLGDGANHYSSTNFNYRHVQDLNGRKFTAYTAGAFSNLLSTPVIVAAALAMFAFN